MIGEQLSLISIEFSNEILFGIRLSDTLDRSCCLVTPERGLDTFYEWLSEQVGF